MGTKAEGGTMRTAIAITLSLLMPALAMAGVNQASAGAADVTVSGITIAQAAPYGVPTVAPYVRVLVDGQPVNFDVPPIIVDGHVLVPLRGVFERLGAGV